MKLVKKEESPCTEQTESTDIVTPARFRSGIDKKKRDRDSPVSEFKTVGGKLHELNGQLESEIRKASYRRVP